MKTPKEMVEYFRSMPKKKIEPNPYWIFQDNPLQICSTLENMEDWSNIRGKPVIAPIDLKKSKPTFQTIREFFRRYYESFHSESQVLCVTDEDAQKLRAQGIPMLEYGQIWPFEVTVLVLPQDNSMGNTVLSEAFWQDRIIGQNIRPVARIHSHHIFDAYQSMTDYSTLNSGTLEIVIGKIMNAKLSLCYWLDVPGTDTKNRTFLAEEMEDGSFAVVQRSFHGPVGNRRNRNLEPETVLDK